MYIDWENTISFAYLNNINFTHEQLNTLRNEIISLKEALLNFSVNNGDVKCLNIMRPLYNISIYIGKVEKQQEVN